MRFTQAFIILLFFFIHYTWGDDRPFTVGYQNVFLENIPNPQGELKNVGEFFDKVRIYSRSFDDREFPRFDVYFEDDTIPMGELRWIPDEPMYMNFMIQTFCQIHGLEWDFTFRKEGNRLNVRRATEEHQGIESEYTMPDRYSPEYRSVVLDAALSGPAYSWKDNKTWRNIEFDWKDKKRRQSVFFFDGYSDKVFVIPLNIFSPRHHEGYIWAMHGIHSTDLIELGDDITIHGRGNGWYWYNHINTVDKAPDQLDYEGSDINDKNSVRGVSSVRSDE